MSNTCSNIVPRDINPCDPDIVPKRRTGASHKLALLSAMAIIGDRGTALSSDPIPFINPYREHIDLPIVEYATPKHKPKKPNKGVKIGSYSSYKKFKK